MIDRSSPHNILGIFGILLYGLHMGRACIHNPALAGALVASGMTWEEAARRTGYANANSLKATLGKKGISKRRITASAPEPDSNVVQTLAVRVAKQAGEILREKYGEILHSLADILEEIGPGTNRKQLKMACQALESQIRAAKIVYGWGSDSSETFKLVHIGSTSQILAAGPATPLEISQESTASENGEGSENGELNGR